MEFTKTEKFDLSKIAITSRRKPLTTRLNALEVGEGFVVEGVERENIMSRMASLRRDGRKFATMKLGALKFQIIRTA